MRADLGYVGLCLGHLGDGYKHEKLRSQTKTQVGAPPLIASVRDDPITISRVPFECSKWLQLPEEETCRSESRRGCAVLTGWATQDEGHPRQSFPQVLSTLLAAPNPALKVLQEEIFPAYTGQDPQGKRCHMLLCSQEGDQL